MVQGWIEGLQRSIDFIEEHLTHPLDIEEIAGTAGSNQPPAVQNS